MRGVNKALLIGNVGNDPEVRDVGSARVANFSLATQESWKDKDGNKQERTEWHRCQAWGPLAGVVEQWVTKGTKLYIEGRIQTRTYEKDGEKRYATEIRVDQLVMLGGGKQDHDAQPQPRQRSTTKPKATAGTMPEDFFGPDDDLPF